jgi:cob(I)alamin adenosyltransferase
MHEKGLIVVFTGDGRGRSSAALGIALRASGHKLYVSVVQFIKSASAFIPGEARAFERLRPEVEFAARGSASLQCSASTESSPEHRKAAEEALQAARQRMHSGGWDILVLDEVNTAVDRGLLAVNDILELLRNKPSRIHVILTGCSAHPDIIDIADTVTEMRSLKPAGDADVSIRKGIDY